jgi:hypothetical protein
MREMTMKTTRNHTPRFGLMELRYLIGSFTLLLLLAAPGAFAQQTDEEKGIDQGNYNVKQSIEFGGRITSITGDQQTYDTMVNLRDGPRLLDFTTEMRSLDQRGTVFDRLYFSNFGYGGDPNVVSVLRISKNKWYLFDAMFRHDENFWDYSLLANPFNPAPPPANAPAGFNPVVNAPAALSNTQIVGTSPQSLNTRRNMQNYGVTILPDSKIRFRLGYNHNTDVGPSFSTTHEGTEQLLLQNLSSTLTQYRLGVDFRFLPHTNISYDQIWSYYKTDPNSSDQNQQFSVGTGFPPVDLGVSWNGPPCNPAFQPGGLVTSTCNAFYSYQFHWRSRTNAPTEQISLQSNPISSLQISGKFSYTGSDLNVSDYQQSFEGRVSKSNLFDYAESGPIQGRHVASYGDLGATWKITHDFNLVDSFHYGNWNEPAQYTSTQCSLFSTSLIVQPTVFVPTAPLPATSCVTPPGLANGTPTHTTSSGADILVNLDNNFLKQQIITNLIEGRLQISTKAGAYFGYRFTHRVIADKFDNMQNGIYFPDNAARKNCALDGGVLPQGCTQNADGSISFQNATFEPASSTDINSNSAVLGLWLKPVQHLSINIDADFGRADKTFTHLSPLNYQEYRARVQYRVAAWLNLNGYFRTTEGQNPIANVNGSQHNRNGGFSLSITPSEKLSTQLGYNYTNIASGLFICFTSSQAQPGLPACPGLSGLLQQFSSYHSTINTGFIDVLWTPVNRLSFEVGANLLGVSGSEVNLNPLSPIATAPAGALNSDWYQPYGSVAYHFAKHWTGRARWDYYGYHEDSNGSYQDLFAPRNFRGNLVTLSVRFGF